MSDFNMPIPQNRDIKYEFNPLSEETVFEMNLYDINSDVSFKDLQTVSSDILYKKKNSKIIVFLQQKDDEIVINTSLLGEYLNMFPLKSPEKINMYFFKPASKVQGRKTPIIIFSDKSIREKEILDRVLDCKDVDIIKKGDLKILKEGADIFKILTYELR
ncbi:MAG: hypothetical protein LBE91_16970 [Tannerella sp.]|nr:hypothetical protein [Tannerella sp.]